MRACGQEGYNGLEKFATLMNLPKPVTSNSYNKIIKHLNVATKVVAELTITDARRKIRGDNAPEGVILDTPVCRDGTW